MRRQGTTTTGGLALLLLLLSSSSPTPASAFTFFPTGPRHTHNLIKPTTSVTTTTTTTTSLASQRPGGGGGGGGDDYYTGLENETDDVYLQSLKSAGGQGQPSRGPPPPSGGPVRRSPEEIKRLNEEAKARMEAYSRGELPPGYGKPPPPPPQAQPGAPPPTEAFNPNKFMDFYYEHEAKLAAENAAKAAIEAAKPPPTYTGPAGAPIVQELPTPYTPPPKYQSTELTPPPTPEKTTPTADYGAMGGSRFQGVFDGGAAAKTNPAKERLKQYLLSRYPPDDMSEQAVNYRRMIQMADTGYSGPQTEAESAYITQLKKDAREKIKSNPWQTMQPDELPGATATHPRPPSNAPPPPPSAPGLAPGPYTPPQTATGYPQIAPQQGAIRPGAPQPYFDPVYDAPPAPPAPVRTAPPPPPQAAAAAPPAAAFPSPATYATPPNPVVAPTYTPPPPPPPPAAVAPVAPPVYQPQPQAYTPPPPQATGSDSSLQQLQGALTQYSATGQMTDLSRLEGLLREVSGLLQGEGRGGGGGGGVAPPPPAQAPVQQTQAPTQTQGQAKPPPAGGGGPPFLLPDEQRQVLMTASGALESVAEAGTQAKVQVGPLSALLTKALHIIEGIGGGGGGGGGGSSAAPAAPAPTAAAPVQQPQQPQAPPQASSQAAATAAAATATPTPYSPPPTTTTSSSSSSTPTTKVDPVDLDQDERAKLQGIMALVLKHSGAFGAMSGPLMGEELALLKTSLKDTMSFLRQETEIAYGQSIEEYLEAHPEEAAKARAAAAGEYVASAEPSQFAVPVFNPPSGKPKSYKELLEEAKKKKLQQA